MDTATTRGLINVDEEISDEYHWLNWHFGGIDLSLVDEERARYGDNLLLIVPKISFLSRFWKIPDPWGEGYEQIRRKVFELLSSRHPRFYQAIPLGSTRLDSRGIAIWQELEAASLGDVMVLPMVYEEGCLCLKIPDINEPLGTVHTCLQLLLASEIFVKRNIHLLRCVSDVGYFDDEGNRWVPFFEMDYPEDEEEIFASVRFDFSV